MVDISSYLRSSHTGIKLQEVLQEPMGVLLGVSTAAENAVNEFGIKTVFDLGSSRLFAIARAAAEAARLGTTSGRLGLAPSDWLDPAISFESLEDIGSLPIENLRGVTDAQANTLKTALDVDTIRDFAFWLPYQAAHKLVGEASGSTIDPDEQHAEELRPRFGEYPTERVYYDKLVMLQMDESTQRTPLTAPISLTPAVDLPLGFGKPAVGAILTYSQSWYAKGVTLGHMLHSLALAPGEATRIAVIDWSRRTRATTAETISETEQLDNVTNHSRAVSEVQNAVANEMQEGGSMSRGWARSESESTASASSSGLLNSLFVSGSGSRTTQESTTATAARSASWSVGNRSVLANMTQNVNDRTEQHANSVRNRRASAVREVSQSEHEQISTRIVANYNHMHALTVQYYEVIQVYQVTAQLHRAERCLFVPFELLDFKAPNAMDIIERFRAALVSGALTDRARDLLTDETTKVAIIPTVKVNVPGTGPVVPGDFSVGATEIGTGSPPSGDTDTAADTSKKSTFTTARAELMWNSAEIVRVSREFRLGILRPGSNALHFPEDTELLGLSFSGVNLATVRLERPGSTNNLFTVPPGDAHVDFPADIRLRDIDAIFVARAANDTLHAGSMTLDLSHQGQQSKTPTIRLQLTPGTVMQKVLDVQIDEPDRQKELLTHLRANQAHYSQVVFGSLDSATLVMLLSQYTWNGKSLADQLEPTVQAVAGNYLVLGAPVDEDKPSGVIDGENNFSWGEVLKERGIIFTDSDKRLVPIPTAGVFAEAVLGRSNSAEKLDITRFWNWDDSPIPLQPTEISPVGTGSRGTTEGLTPGQLSSPVLNIVNPTSLPDPAGLGASLGVLANSNLFRDMSGLQGTQSIAEAAVRETLTAATQAGQLASTNLQTEAQKAVAMGQIAADIAKAAITGKPPSGSTKGISADGARINHGRDMDKRGVSEGGGTAGSMSAGGIGDGVGGSGLDSRKPNPFVGTSSREKRYADQGAHKYSPDAIKDTTPPPTTQPRGKGADRASDRRGKEAEKVVVPDISPDEMTQIERAESRILEYVQDASDVIAAAHNDAFIKFKAWYLTYEHNRKSAAVSTVRKLMTFLFETSFSFFLPVGGGIYVKLIEGAGKKLLAAGLGSLDSSQSVDTQFVIARLEVVESSFITKLSTFHRDYWEAENTGFDNAVNAFLENIEYDPGPPELAQEVKDILQADGIPEPTGVTRQRILEKTLARLIEVIVINTITTAGVNIAEFMNADSDKLALLLALKEIDPIRNKERICELERLVFGNFADPDCF